LTTTGPIERLPARIARWLTDQPALPEIAVGAGVFIGL
jgi:hypothetical protein